MQVLGHGTIANFSKFFTAVGGSKWLALPCTFTSPALACQYEGCG
jgi:hypothetical protein